MRGETTSPVRKDTESLNLKGAFPFRIGTTSYILAADILPNLRHVRNRVDDVELVLFESDEFSNMPSPDDVEEMTQLRWAADLTYTVHLPLDTQLGSGDEAERTASVGKCRRVIERMKSIEPFAWILHLHGDRRGDPPSDNMARWTEQNRRSLSELLEGGPKPQFICVETLDYAFENIAELVETLHLSVCLDIGHLLVNGRDVAAHLSRWLDRARVFHVHGVKPSGQDHADLSYLPQGLLEDLAGRLARLPTHDKRVVTVEIFGEDDFERSIRVVAERLCQDGGSHDRPR